MHQDHGDNFTRATKQTWDVPHNIANGCIHTASMWKLSGDEPKLILSDMEVFLSNNSSHSEKLKFVFNIALFTQVSPKT